MFYESVSCAHVTPSTLVFLCHGEGFYYLIYVFSVMRYAASGDFLHICSFKIDLRCLFLLCLLIINYVEAFVSHCCDFTTHKNSQVCPNVC